MSDLGKNVSDWGGNVSRLGYDLLVLGDNFQGSGRQVDGIQVPGSQLYPCTNSTAQYVCLLFRKIFSKPFWTVETTT